MKKLSQRNRRSEALTKDEHVALKNFIGAQPTLTDAAEMIGVSRQVLSLVEIKGSGKPSTIKLVRKVIQPICA